MDVYDELEEARRIHGLYDHHRTDSETESDCDYADLDEKYNRYKPASITIDEKNVVLIKAEIKKGRRNKKNGNNVRGVGVHKESSVTKNNQNKHTRKNKNLETNEENNNERKVEILKRISQKISLLQSQQNCAQAVDEENTEEGWIKPKNTLKLGPWVYTDPLEENKKSKEKKENCTGSYPSSTLWKKVFANNNYVSPTVWEIFHDMSDEEYDEVKQKTSTLSDKNNAQVEDLETVEPETNQIELEKEVEGYLEDNWDQKQQKRKAQKKPKTKTECKGKSRKGKREKAKKSQKKD